jgi:hypothetical protein
MAQIMRRIDYDGDGFIDFSEFQACLCNGVELEDGEEERELAELDRRNKPKIVITTQTVVPKSLGEFGFQNALGGASKREKVSRITERQLAMLRVKIKPITRFDSCWTSKGSMSRTKMSVWAPDTTNTAFERARRKHKRLICVGHYPVKNFKEPNKRLVVEVMDSTSLASVRGSQFLDEALDVLFPHPVRFHQVWSEPRAATPFYTWELVPPSDDFVGVGMIATNSDQQPPVECVRCVPRSFTRSSTTRESRLWQDSGAGRSGSVWIVNEMKLLCITEGHSAPDGDEQKLDFVENEFKASQYFALPEVASE